jgi:hypothetical protein
MSLSDIGREAAEASSQNGGDGTMETSYERYDLSGTDFTKMHPGLTAIAGTATTLRYVGPSPNDDGSYNEDDRGWAGVVLEDMRIPEDESTEPVTIFESTSPSGDDYKVVNADHDSVDTYEAGVSVGKMFESDETDTFSGDDNILKLGTNAGRSVIRALDVSGLSQLDLVRDEDGTPELTDNGYPIMNDGLIEDHPDNDEDNYTQPRYRRDPQIRPDVEGQEVVIILQHLEAVDPDYSGRSHWATALANLEDDRQAELAQEYADDPYYEGDSPDDFLQEFNGTEYLRLAPTTDFSPDEDLVRETGWVEWSYPSDDEIEAIRDERGYTDT